MSRRADGSLRPALLTAGLLACLALVAALLAGGGGPAAPLPGLPDAGLLTGWGLPLLRLAGTVAAVGTIGLLLTGAALVPAPGGALTPVASATLHAAGRWSATWCATALCLPLLAASDTTGVPVTGLSQDLLWSELASSQGRALLAVAAVSGAVAAGAGRARSPGQARAWLAVGLSGLLPATVTGHAATTADHYLATTALVVHVVAATLWLGGLLAVLVRLHGHPVVLSQAVSRFSVLALGCFLAVGMSGALSASGQLGRPSQAWLSGYGGLVLAKALALALLGAFGWQHRRRMLPALAAGRSRAFLELAGAELAVMGATLGLAVALSRTPTPEVAAVVAAPVHGTGHASLATSVEPMTLTRLLLEWRPDALVLVLIGLLLTAYGSAVRAVRAGGGSWPLWRLGLFAGGSGVALIALVGGLAAYSPAQVSAQLAQFLLLLLVAPTLLVHGAPFTLWARVRTGALPAPDAQSSPLLQRAGRALTAPLTAGLLVTGLVLVLYRTPLFELALRSPWVHLLVNLLTLVIGVLVVRPVADPLPSERAGADRALPLVAVTVTLTLLALQLGWSDELLAGRWFLEINWPWIDPLADQRLGALLVAGTTAVVVPLLALSLAPRSGRRTGSGATPAAAPPHAGVPGGSTPLV